MNNYRWNLREADAGQVADLARACGLSKVIARCCVARGYSDPAEVEGLMNPSLSGLSDPFLLPDMEVAVDRVRQALAAGETILIFGDYDVDGVTSTALLTRTLRGLGAARVETFIPHRIEDGYGLGVEALCHCLKTYAPQLLITVDCGTASVEAVAEARSQGVDVIITDHHDAEGARAEALAVINPQRAGTEPGLRKLAGVGVAFKLAHALVKTGRARNEAPAKALDLREELPLVAMGTIADMVPLEGENRILARAGLDRINRGGGGVGLRALMRVAGIKGPVDGYHVGFLLGPRINAAGRMDTPAIALHLLLTDKESEALQIASELDDANRERQQVEKDIVVAALAEIEARYDPARDFGLVVGQSGWHPGVVGIVASRIMRRYHRPAIVVGFDEEGRGKGSCRGIEGFHLVRTLEEVGEHLVKFGGHAMAAGLEVREARFPAFAEAFNRAAREALQGRDLTPIITLDAWMDPEQISLETEAEIQRLSPFGSAHSAPRWGLKNARVLDAREVGKGHLKLRVEAGGKSFDAIGFGMADQAPEKGSFIDLAFQLQRNEFRGNVSPSLKLEDLRVVDV